MIRIFHIGFYTRLGFAPPCVLWEDHLEWHQLSWRFYVFGVQPAIHYGLQDRGILVRLNPKLLS